MPSGGTLIRVPVKDALQKDTWSCMISGRNDENKSISVVVNVPPNAIIGRYKLAVVTTTEMAKGKETQRSAKPDVIVLFNPFSPGKTSMRMHQFNIKSLRKSLLLLRLFRAFKTFSIAYNF